MKGAGCPERFVYFTKLLVGIKMTNPGDLNQRSFPGPLHKKVNELKLDVRRRGMLFQEALDSCLATFTVQTPMGLGT